MVSLGRQTVAIFGLSSLVAVNTPFGVASQQLHASYLAANDARVPPGGKQQRKHNQ
jgi:hypothetical protein